MRDLPPAARLPLLFFGMISLLAGVAAGLARLGWEMPPLAARAAGWHGALMIPAFFGTVIGLERAVAIGRLWAYAAPAAAGLGSLCLIAGAPVAATQALTLLGAAVMLAASLQVLDRLTAPFTIVLALGAACWLVGNLAWLLRYDIARRNARQSGLTRYIALCLLSGYVWLALSGALGPAGALAPGNPWRDAAVHALALGFVFGMVFGHAPTIFPAVARVKIPYHPAFYLPLLALHASLAWRVSGGLAGDFAVQRGAAAANAGALLLLIATIVTSVVRGRRQTAKEMPDETS